MRKLCNTLFVMTPDTYLALEGENIVLRRDGEETARRPLHYIDSIVVFGYMGISPALMGACMKRGVTVCFMTPHGRMLARVTGPQQRNVLLRKKQYRVSDDPQESAAVARSMVLGKLYNAKWMLHRVKRDHAARLDTVRLEQVIGALQEGMNQTAAANSLEGIRGIEGSAANRYFSVIDDLILQQKNVFFFKGRSRRPPMDAFNAVLSFCYALLANDVAGALEAVGLDPYVGFLHRDRPGRTSLALDVMEELRPIFVDRFVLNLINKRIINGEGFTQEESGAVMMDEGVRRIILKNWQEKKTSEITHPFLKEQMQWGVIPFAQCLLLARYLRADIDAYPPFFWK